MQLGFGRVAPSFLVSSCKRRGLLRESMNAWKEMLAGMGSGRKTYPPRVRELKQRQVVEVTARASTS